MKSKIKSVFHLAWPYIAIALLPVMAVILLSNYIANKASQETLLAWQESVKVASDRVNSKIETVEELAYFIARSDVVSSYVFEKKTGESDRQSSAQVKNLLDGISRNENITEIFFYDGYADRIIASDTILDNAEMFFRYQYIYDDCTSKEAAQAIKNYAKNYGFSKTRHVISDGRPSDVIEYIILAPIEKPGENTSRLVLAIDTENLFRDIKDLMTADTSFCVVGDKGVMYSFGTVTDEQSGADLSSELLQMTGRADSYYGMQRTINGGLWQIRFFVPSEELEQTAGYIALRLLPALAIILLCLILCIYFTHKNHMQIRQILDTLKSGDAEPENDRQEFVDYKLVHSYAEVAASRNVDAREKIKKLQLSQRNTTFKHLLKGTYASDDDKRAALENLELGEVADKYAVICIRYNDLTNVFDTEDSGVRELILELLENEIGTGMEIVDTSPFELSCIMEAGEDFAQTVNEIVSLLNVQINYKYNADLRIGAGEAVDSLADISVSYKQACETIRYSENTGKKIYFYSQADLSGDVIYYPEQTDDKISNYIIAGYADEAISEIDEIYKKNITENTRILSAEAISLLRFRVTNAVLSVAEKMDVQLSQEYIGFINEKDINRYFQEVKGTVIIMTEKLTDKKSNVQNSLAVQINDYIGEHFSDSGLNIKQVAWHFHFHENYISNIYRREYNTNLSTAIEKLRIEKACDLLENSNIKIGAVSESVGYALDSSFRRAFKKLTGLSPVEYRNLHRGEKKED